jgi:alanine-synthesizing transaminase
VRFSNRLPTDAAPNALTRAVEVLRAEGIAFADLTESNPTIAGLPYPDDLLAALSDARGLRYEPHPLGLRSAREAVARDFGRRGASVDPAHIVLSASTSEAYSWLFKLLCSPGERVLVPQPSYPLFEHLTRLEGVATSSYGLEYHGRWEIDLERIRCAPRDTRAVLLVSPNNPTGSFVSRQELTEVTRCCRDRGWALVADEVFADYPLDAADPITDVAARADVLAFTLGGASKSLGLPQVKLGWMLAGGPPTERDAALTALELIADSFLSVGTPVQVAASGLLDRASAVRAAIHDRIRRNLARARAIVRTHPACELLRVEGGWSAVVRLPATRDEETLVHDLLRHHRVLVHPGYYFDLPRGSFAVISLLTREEIFADAFARLVSFADS